MAKRYGIAFLLYMTKMGTKTRHIITIECVGPRCSINGIKISMSGITDNKNISGMLILVLRILAVNLPIIYPSDKWPTAYDSSSSFSLRNFWKIINFATYILSYTMKIDLTCLQRFFY